MRKPIVGAEAIADGALTRGQLRWNYSAVLPGVYLAKNAKRTVFTNGMAAWLWTGRTAVIAGRAAAAIHGAKWVDASTPIEVIAEHTRQRADVIVGEERIADDEITFVGELPVTTPARTALDIGGHLERNQAVAHLDALAASTGVTSADGRGRGVAEGDMATTRAHRRRPARAADADQSERPSARGVHRHGV